MIIFSVLVLVTGRISPKYPDIEQHFAIRQPSHKPPILSDFRGSFTKNGRTLARRLQLIRKLLRATQKRAKPKLDPFPQLTFGYYLPGS
jgi:hypothetical protein